MAPQAILTVHVKGLRDLKNVETMGMTMDPYLKIVVGGKVHRTKVATDAGTSAQYDEVFRVPVEGAVEMEHLYLEVEDKDIFGSKQVGMAKIPLAGIPPVRYDGAFHVYCTRGKQTGTVDLGLCLERFSANTQPQPYPELSQPPVMVAPIPLAAPASSAVYMQPSPPIMMTTMMAPAPVVMSMCPPATPPHRPPSRHPQANSGYPAAASPSRHQQQHQQQQPAVVMPGPLAYASTPARPYTPVPPPSLVAFAPYPPSHLTHNTQPQPQQTHSPTTSAFFSTVSQPLTPPSTMAPPSPPVVEAPLPPYWEARRTEDGQVFYVDHLNKTTSWERPVAAPLRSGAPAYSW